MKMVEIKGILEKFDKQGEKTGWTYMLIPAIKARAISEVKTIFRVKGFIDDYPIKQIAILPMGEGDFILPVNLEMRKAIRKSKGSGVVVRLQYDPSPLEPDADFVDCLAEFPAAKTFYLTLTQGHKNYFTKWLSTAKTQETKSNRIAMAVDALSRGLGFGEMLREKKSK
jgi:hypothetical protein